MIDNTDARTEIGNVTADGSGWADFADVADRLVTIWHVEAARAVQFLPLRLVSSVAVEHLDPVVFAVGDIDPTIGVAADVVDDIELTLASSGFAPRRQQFTVGRVFVDAGIAVTVGNIDLAFRGERRVGTAVERLTAHKRRWLAGNAELEQDLAVQSDLAYEMSAIVGQEHCVVGSHMDPV